MLLEFLSDFRHKLLANRSATAAKTPKGENYSPANGTSATVSRLKSDP